MAEFIKSMLGKSGRPYTFNNLNRDSDQPKSSESINSLSKFHTAIEYGEQSKVEKILETDIDIDAPNDDGLTALMIAVYEEHQSIIKVLLEHGADTTAIRCNHTRRCENFKLNQTVLHYAVEFVNEGNIVELLITVKPNSKTTSSEGFNKVFGYQDDRKSVLLLAIEKKSLKLVELLLENGASLHRVYDEYDDDYGQHIVKSYSILHVAVNLYNDNQDKKLISRLLDYCDINETAHCVEYGEGATYIQYRYFITALDIAIMNNNLELVEILLSLGADINCKCDSGFTTASPLHTALRSNFEIFKYLLDSKKVTSESLESVAKIIQSSEFPEESAIVLCQLLMSDEYRRPEFESIAFHLAIVSKDHELVDSFLNRYPNICVMKWDQLYPIHRAAECNNYYCLNRLLDLGADIDLKDDLGRTALEWAMEKSYISMVLFIVSKGADVNALSYYSNTLLIEVAEDHRTEIIEILIDAGAHIKLFKNYIDYYPYMISVLVNIVEHHIIKLKAANMDVNPDCLKLNKSLTSEVKDKSFPSDCIDEIDKLKKEKISETSYLSYYHFLTKDVRRLANYTRNDEITSRFNSDHLKNNFPIYGQMIITFYSRALKRLKLIQNLDNLLFDVFDDLPLTFVCNVKNYFSDNDLKTMLINNK